VGEPEGLRPEVRREPSFKDGEKRRLFDDHVVLAGLPE
jgi:hypothetical protein